MVQKRISKVSSFLTPKFEGNNLKSIYSFVFGCLMVCAIQFLVLTTLAAFIYPGGYDYFKYYFSELGRNVAINGENNPFSSVLFSLSMLIASVTLIPFWMSIPLVFLRSPVERLLSSCASGFGLLSVPMQIMIGVFPTDTYPILHGLAAQGFFVLSSLSILIYSFIMYFNQNYSNYLSLIGFCLFLVVILFVLGIFGEFQPLVQKIIVYSFIIWSSTQIYWSWHHSTSINTTNSGLSKI